MHRLDSVCLSRTIRETAARLRVRAVVQAGWAQLSSDTDDILTIDSSPHDWLFPSMRAAVHHAGPGTAHASITAATPALPIPVALDQPYWARRVTTLGLAPTAIPAQRITTGRLTTALSATLHQDCYGHRTRTAANALARQCGITNLLTHLAHLVSPRIT